MAQVWNAGNGPTLSFTLPWPWDGEWFALHDVPRLAFITGPLGSGKTRFAQRLAAELPDAKFLGLERLSDPTLEDRLADDALLANRVESRLAWLIEDPIWRHGNIQLSPARLRSMPAGNGERKALAAIRPRRFFAAPTQLRT